MTVAVSTTRIPLVAVVIHSHTSSQALAKSALVQRAPSCLKKGHRESLNHPLFPEPFDIFGREP